MSFERAREVTPELIVREHSASTNTELVSLAAGSELADFTVLATLDQSAGRGRLGRSWVAPAGTALAASVLLRPRRDDAPLPTGRFGWFPIAAGVAMADTVAELVAEPVGCKWPNDVLIDGRNVCGILAELLPDGTGLVIGSGVNLTATAQQLPVPTATSLAVEGVSGDAAELADRVLAGYLDRLRDLVRDYLAAGADAQRSGLHALAVLRCTTLGRPVRVELPGGEVLAGTATSLDADGRLLVEKDGAVRAVAAGDVTHVR